MIKLVRKQRNSPGEKFSYCYYLSYERGKLQPDITAKIIIISYFTVVYFKLGRFVHRKSFNSFLVNEMSCCVFKSFFSRLEFFSSILLMKILLYENTNIKDSFQPLNACNCISSINLQSARICLCASVYFQLISGLGLCNELYLKSFQRENVADRV